MRRHADVAPRLKGKITPHPSRHSSRFATSGSRAGREALSHKGEGDFTLTSKVEWIAGSSPALTRQTVCVTRSATQTPEQTPEGPVPFHLPPPLAVRELARADGLARAGHAIDLGRAGAPNEPVQEDLVRHETSARRRDVAAGDGDADVDHAAMAVGRGEDHLPASVERGRDGGRGESEYGESGRESEAAHMIADHGSPHAWLSCSSVRAWRRQGPSGPAPRQPRTKCVKGLMRSGLGPASRHSRFMRNRRDARRSNSRPLKRA